MPSDIPPGGGSRSPSAEQLRSPQDIGKLLSFVFSAFGVELLDMETSQTSRAIQ